MSFSDPNHEQLFPDRNDALDDCFEKQLLEEDGDIYSCFGKHGEEIAIWPNGSGIPFCSKILFVDVDMAYSRYEEKAAEKLVSLIRNYMRTCPLCEKIKIVGSGDCMRELKGVTQQCWGRSDYSGFIAGINVIKTKPVLVTCLSKFGRGPSSGVRKVRYW